MAGAQPRVEPWVAPIKGETEHWAEPHRGEMEHWVEPKRLYPALRVVRTHSGVAVPQGELGVVVPQGELGERTRQDVVVPQGGPGGEGGDTPRARSTTVTATAGQSHQTSSIIRTSSILSDTGHSSISRSWPSVQMWQNVQKRLFLDLCRKLRTTYNEPI